MNQLTFLKVCDVNWQLSTRVCLVGAILVSLVFYGFGPMSLIVPVAMGWLMRARYVVDFVTGHGIGQQKSSPFDYSECPHFMMRSGVTQGPKSC